MEEFFSWLMGNSGNGATEGAASSGATEGAASSGAAEGMTQYNPNGTNADAGLASNANDITKQAPGSMEQVGDFAKNQAVDYTKGLLQPFTSTVDSLKNIGNQFQNGQGLLNTTMGPNGQPNPSALSSIMNVGSQLGKMDESSNMPQIQSNNLGLPGMVNPDFQRQVVIRAQPPITPYRSNLARQAMGSYF
jgi:hypothetical protein